MESITEMGASHALQAGQMRSLYAYLQQVTDGRARRGRRYEAAFVLTLMLLAKLAGAPKGRPTLSGIAQWVRLRQPWLSEVLGGRGQDLADPGRSGRAAARPGRLCDPSHHPAQQATAAWTARQPL